MSANLLSYLSSLFGSEQCSDCMILLCVESDETHPGAPNKRLKREDGSAAPGPADNTDSSSAATTAVATATTGLQEHLPAHLVLLRGGSPRFAAQAERWTRDHGGEAGGCRPQLRVPLDRVEDLPYAKAALQYIYSGKLGVHDTAGLLQIWRIASYLQVEGCVESCVSALTARLGAAETTPYGAIAELYGHRELLTDATVDLRAAALLAACREQLTRGSAAGDALTTAGMPAGEAGLGEVLTWLFPDAPSVMSDPEVRRHAMALPPHLLQALLCSDRFATDDEASVLLLLLCWLQTNFAAVADANADAHGGWPATLFHHIRLLQMNPTYLYSILDQVFVGATVRLPWLPYTLGRQEHLLLCQFAAEASDVRRKALAASAQRWYNCTSPWYGTQPRPRARRDAGVPYEWYVPLADLSRALTGSNSSIVLSVAFRNGASHQVSDGFAYKVMIGYKKKAPSAFIFLVSSLPPVLQSAGVKITMGVASAAARLTVRRHHVCGGAAAEETLSWGLREEVDVMGLGVLGGTHAVLPLGLLGGGAGGDGDAAAEGLALAPWASYLQSDQTISGTLTWL